MIRTLKPKPVVELHPSLRADWAIEGYCYAMAGDYFIPWLSKYCPRNELKAYERGIISRCSEVYKASYDMSCKRWIIKPQTETARETRLF